MNEKEMFENGCFLPSWTEEVQNISPVFTRSNKDLQTLLKELDAIKDRIQEIQARQWHLAKLIHFNKNSLAKE